MAAPPDVTARVDDVTLIERSWRRPDAFAVLYDRYFGDVYRYLAGRAGPQVADDLAAETFLVAFGKRRTFDPGRGAVRPWLFGIATNLLAQHRRSETRRLEALQRTPAEGRAEGGHEDRVAARLVAASAQGPLAAELRRLPDGDRDVLLLVALADLSYEEVALALDIPPGTVGSRLNRARRRLRAALGGVNPMIGGSE
ncbi:RNA polymerase sigma factor [Nonomuraea muscovyensis]|uniref:RNA polymerase sigma-70 factor (ECF subfamily) n=1 Tax=Nonomuraea muscovyensis TaxID=1124761 RepID=A0A7X0BZA7_9ACTN|nr:RNA polymerase sigma factor [Nonomuraea muscovyensis]MBB6345669.1 RNA polymerase sigma-70 factor (ECF subfamily) [Nonomuraea muscovyensis]MDF2706976.1 polymerase subunit sigma-70 [Nonomuraea muscovyensis]